LSRNSFIRGGSTHRRRRQPRSLGNLVAAHAFDKPNEQCVAVRLGQAADNLEDRERLGLDRIAAGEIGRQLDLLAHLAHVVGCAVARDGGDPAAEGRRVAQLADAPEDDEEHFLDQVVDVAPRNATEQDGVDQARIIGVQAGERVLIAGRDGANRRAERGGPVRDRHRVAGG
jgi:hypothetical protein